MFHILTVILFLKSNTICLRLPYPIGLNKKAYKPEIFSRIGLNFNLGIVNCFFLSFFLNFFFIKKLLFFLRNLLKLNEIANWIDIRARLEENLLWIILFILSILINIIIVIFSLYKGKNFYRKK